MVQRLTFALMFGLFLVVPAQGQVLVGDPATDRNCFPFGCDVADNTPTRYQQVYDASVFSSAFDITDISFFRQTADGDLNQGTFAFWLSTTSAAVNGLSTDMNANLGTDNTLFGSYVLGGAAPSVLTFSGGGFSYDPGLGNLLLDIRITDYVKSSNRVWFDSRNQDTTAPFSRMHDFSPDDGNDYYSGYGLVTEFNRRAETVPEPTTVLLLATGLLALGLVGRYRC